MVLRDLRFATCGFLAVAVAGCFLAAHSRPVYSGVTVHEWGTFTSIAGKNGEAVEWQPLTASTDLPGFVEHFRDSGFKVGLLGTVRMETPVLYFYSSREQSVSVQVHFSKGLITEWYPRASRVAPGKNFFGRVPYLNDRALHQKDAPDGSITWDSVTIAPGPDGNFPTEPRGNRYYAARQTTSTPLRVKTPAGEQYEKFLFYRGVSSFSVPIAATLPSGGKVQTENRGADEIPNIILFERRGDKLGYRIDGPLHQAVLEPPELNGTVESLGDSLGHDLEGILVAQGLYQNEAHAMVETWRDSWFEEGSRLLYVVPEKFLNSVLPLSIKPMPEQIVRVFVGRLELLTPATQNAVERAFANHDEATLQKYSRFLEPILHLMIQQSEKEGDANRVAKLTEDLNAVYASPILRNQRKN